MRKRPRSRRPSSHLRRMQRGVNAIKHRYTSTSSNPLMKRGTRRRALLMIRETRTGSISRMLNSRRSTSNITPSLTSRWSRHSSHGVWAPSFSEALRQPRHTLRSKTEERRRKRSLLLRGLLLGGQLQSKRRRRRRKRRKSLVSKRRDQKVGQSITLD